MQKVLDVDSAVAAWMPDGERSFLEIDRFDRTKQGGPLGLISFFSPDAEYEGHESGWERVAIGLIEAGQLEPDALSVIRRLEYFAQLVGNTDRHLGNLSVHFDDSRPMGLTPIYDTLPMHFAPTQTGMNSAPMDLSAAKNANGGLTHDNQMKCMSSTEQFWRECSQDLRISESMREVCAQHAEQLAVALSSRPASAPVIPLEVSPR